MHNRPPPPSKEVFAEEVAPAVAEIPESVPEGAEEAPRGGDEGKIVPFPRGEIGQIRRNPYLLAAAASPLLLSLAALISGITGDPRHLAFMVHPAIFAVVFVALAWNRNFRPNVTWPEVQASRSGVRVGERFVPRARITDGFLVPRAGARSVVRLGLRGMRPAMELSVEGEATGRRLLRALGLDTTQTVARFRLLSQFYAGGKMRWVTAAVAAGLVLLARLALGIFSVKAGFFLVPLFVLAGLFLMLAPTKVEVGVDGILVRWLGRTRFVPIGDILYVDTTIRGMGRNRVLTVLVSLRSGEILDLPVTQRGWDDGRASIVAERIREAMAASHAEPGAVEDAARLSRGSRPFAEWVADLRAIGSGANATHRVAPVPPERLWRVVEDPGSAASARAAAAVALAPALDDEGRLRLKRAAQAVAGPRLRVALESTAAGEGAGSADEAARVLEEIAAEEAEKDAAGRF